MKNIKVNYEEEMKQSYIDYAMSVITQRALPDVRDGLKPVHRRTLYAMNELGNFPDKPYKKSARIVGDTLGKFHPHSDASVYDAMVRLAQDYSMREPLVDGHGNFGSIDGDVQASMRYTEARLTPLAMEMLNNLDKNVIDFQPNFDNTLKEPTVLPARFPNLLVNGSTGIAVGMATSIPPHNLEETINALNALIDKPNINTKEIMKHIKGPDFPTGGTISNKDELLDIYETGIGKIKIRAKLEVEDIGGGRKNLIVTEIPYTLSGNKLKIIDDILVLIADKKLEELTEIRDESSKDGMRIVMEVKKGVDIDNLINKLYKITKLEDTFPVNLLAISKKKPVVFTLKGMLEEYLSFLREIHLREITYELNKSIDRREILEGLIRATDVIDLIIEIIRNSKDINMVKNCLINGETKGINFKYKKSETEAKKLLFTEKQANAILGMQLQRLVGLEITKLNSELDDLEKAIKKYERLINSEAEMNKYIKKELEEIKKKYKTDRKTKIDNLEIVEIIEEEIIEDVYVLIDKFNYIKVIDSQSYLRANEETLKEYVEVIKIKNNDSLIIFSELGDMHQIKIKDVPISKMRDRGVPINNLSEVTESKILKIIPYEYMGDEVMFLTLSGLIKKTKKEEFNTIRKSILGTRLNDKDRLICVHSLSEEDKEIVITTKDKREIRFLIDEIPTQGRNAKGVIGINLNQGDEVIDFKVTDATEEKKRKRGAKGQIVK